MIRAALLLMLLTSVASAQPANLVAEGCVACHGPDGKGNQELGAPNLTVRNTLYPNTLDSIRTTIIEGRHGTMPAHRELLGETRARLVAAYVWSLSNSDRTDSPPGRQ